MSSKTFTVSAALCLALVFSPTTALAAPQMDDFPFSGSDPTQHMTSTGDSETDAGLGYNIGIPDGPSFHFGAGFHQKSRAGSCDASASKDVNAGMGYGASIPDGPSAGFGAGVQDSRSGDDCSETETPEVIETVTRTATASTEVVVVTVTAEMSTRTESMSGPSITTSEIDDMPSTSTKTSEMASVTKESEVPSNTENQVTPFETSSPIITGDNNPMNNSPMVLPLTNTISMTTSIATAIAIPIPLYTPTAQIPMHSTPMVQNSAPTGPSRAQPVFNSAPSFAAPQISLMATTVSLLLLTAGMVFY
ncbi:hypothetical protein PDE_09598 [Penicillium oxalicum 114-2]|uniref:Uncharacterized protein n=1 Tax=Penicillium oxalicum (strain 114-2 / CGMCC 5302) TaxID=933388 RepID=S7ZW17_PENO1|nr:hypothetical protein PDE_09598 [Penicillium oxalicum 114-2]